MNIEQLSHLQQQVKFITGVQPVIQVAEQDLVALRMQLAQLRAAIDEIEALAHSGYYGDGNEQAQLGRIIAAINDLRRNQ